MNNIFCFDILPHKFLITAGIYVQYCIIGIPTQYIHFENLNFNEYSCIQDPKIIIIRPVKLNYGNIQTEWINKN